MDNVTLTKRIDDLYQAETRAPTNHGAKTWFARQVGMTPRTVWRWCSGETKPSGAVLELLERLEREAGIG